MSRLLDRLQTKVSMIVGRGVISVINNTEKTQKFQVMFLANEIIDDIERFAEYGVKSFPKKGAQVAAVFKGGNRSNGLVIAVHDRRYEPTDGLEGEVIIYTDEDAVAQDARIHFKRGKIMELLGTLLSLGIAATAQFLVNQLFITSVYNSHKHPESGGGTTGVPDLQGVVGTHSTINTKAS